MSQEERIPEDRTGIVKPTVELRHSLEEAERCRKFFEDGGFMDYLDSVNISYLGGMGIVTGPTLKISSAFELDEEEAAEPGPLGLNENARGGLRATLEYDPDQHRKGEISVFLAYRNIHDVFTLLISASLTESMANIEGGGNPISNGRSLNRRFSINPTGGMVGDVDDLLLTFTGELLDERFL